MEENQEFTPDISDTQPTPDISEPTPQPQEPNVYADVLQNLSHEPSFMEYMQNMHQPQTQPPQQPQQQQPQQQPQQQAQDEASILLDYQNKLDMINTQLNQLVTSQKLQAQSQQLENIKTKYQNFNADAIRDKLIEISNTNPAYAQSLDNPSGWELLHLAYFANTRPASDKIINTNNTTSAGMQNNNVYDKIANGTASYSDLGMLF